MGTWKVSTGRTAVEVEGPNWLTALGKGVVELELGQGTLARLVCRVGADGIVVADDPARGLRLEIVPVVGAPAPPPALSMPGASFAAMLEPVAAPPAPRAPDSPPASRPAPEPRGVPAAIAARPAVDRPPAADRVLAAFERAGEIAAAADVDAACRTAVTLLGELVTADAGAVLLRSRAGDTLRFAAAFGPAADRVIGRDLPLDQGLAGFAFGFGLEMIVEDVRRDARHFRGIDRRTGYRTDDLLVVPVRGASGAVRGVMELLNAPEGFGGADLDVARVVAGSLGSWLDRVEG